MNNLSGGRGTTIAVSPRSDSPTGSGGGNRWAVILAGGDGSRLLPLTRTISGDDRPKQFCRIINGNTLLDETRRRVAFTFSPAKTMFVLAQEHEPYYEDALDGVPLGNLIVQPRNAGTAPAILYSLLRLEHIDPAATVAFFPSDHYFTDDHAFMAEVDSAFAAARRSPHSVVLLGIEPEGPDEEYGWIEPEPDYSSDEMSVVRRVRRFWEKPSPSLARELMERGCLWNSFVMVGAVSAFLRMIRHSTPELYMKFASLRSKLSTPFEDDAVQNLYDGLADADFSREVLQARPGDLAVIPVSGSKWSDLGSPHRVFAALSGSGSALITRGRTANLMNTKEGFYEGARIRGSQAV